MIMLITNEQYDFLTRPIQPARVQTLRGQAHLEAWDIRRHLIRVFGFGGFDIETKSLELVAERQHTHDNQGNPLPPHKSRWTVVYRAQVRLIIKTPDGRPIAVYEDGATGDSSNQPSLGDAHDQAMKTALSQGLKRCAVNLGDQFGLCLYNDGRHDAVVTRSLVAPDAQRPAPEQVAADTAPVLPEQVPQAAADDPDTAATPVSAPPAPTHEPMGDIQRRRMFALFRDLGVTDEDKQKETIDWALRQPSGTCTSRGSLTADQAGIVIAGLESVRIRRQQGVAV
jgi:hypothetical protein